MATYFEPEVYTDSEDSGTDDSDEDIITDYLADEVNGNNLDAASSSAAATAATDAATPSIEPARPCNSGAGSVIMSAAETLRQAESCDDAGKSNGGVASDAIPTISVTQHSPAASKAFFILEDNLKQLHGIQESIQRMRQVNVQTLRFQMGSRRSRRGQSGHFSSSCPSLSQGADGQSNNNEPDWLSATLADWADSSAPSGHAHFWGDASSVGGDSRKSSLSGGLVSGGGGSKRRRTWASPLEADEMTAAARLASAVRTGSLAYERGADEGRARSVSLSSADTDENELEGIAAPRSRPSAGAGPSASSSSVNASDNADGIFTARPFKAGHSTHSLNDVGFPLIPSLPAKSRDSSGGAAGARSSGSGAAAGSSSQEPSKWLSPRILTLQKSISTPSILAVKDGSTLAALSAAAAKAGSSSAVGSGNESAGLSIQAAAHSAVASAKDANTIPVPSSAHATFPRMSSSYAGLESETDDDSELHASSRYSIASFNVEPGFENDDDASSKRRKRGSLFFRKRKDKDKEKDKEKDKGKWKQPHQFVPVCHSNSQPCDICSKSLTNKAALRCESCAITVHENSCRDQVSECTRFKVPKSVPLASKVSSLANLKGSSGAPAHGSGVAAHLSGASSTSALPPSAASIGSSSSASVASSSGIGSSSWSIVQAVGAASGSASTVTTPTSSSQTPSTPVASPLFANSAVSKLSGLSQRSQWKRVAAKLGVNKCGSGGGGGGADKDADTSTPNDESSHAPSEADASGTTGGTGTDTIEGVNVAEVKDLDLDPELGILDEEPEAWVGTVDKKISKKLKEKEIKRQEHIYEFIITEKHHCLTLKVMQKIFADGMRRELRFSPETVDRLFPCLEELIEYHCQFLRRLRQRQRQESVVATIEDILRLQFSGPLGDQLRSLYGEFCSRHQEAVSMYKDMVKEDRKFATFARQCTMNPLCKKKGIPECILFVTQRITKYPLLIDPLIKTSREQPEECLKLQEVLAFVKDILIGVNSQVAEKERKLRLIEIYNKIDAKSATTYRNKKFKKSDLLSSTRRLMFEGVAYLNHARGKVQVVTVVVLSDVVFFLQESNQKFHFVTQDNKAGVISLQKLLVREKAGGQDTRSIYLISSNPDEPEMYELQCQNPREKRIWIDTIRSAVEQCPEEDDEENASEGEEQKKIREAQEIKIRQLIAKLRDKDRQLAAVLEDKMGTFCELVDLLANNEDGTNSWLLLGSDVAPPKYAHLVEHGFHSPQAKEALTQATNELYRLLGVLFSPGTAGHWHLMALSRSVSSAGERHSETFSTPALPKRAETFGGFDQNGKDKGVVKKKSPQDTMTDCSPNQSSEQLVVPSVNAPPVLQLNGEQQTAGLELVHNVSTLLTLMTSQATAFEALRAEFMAEMKASRSGMSASTFSVAGPAGMAKFQHKASHNQRLEELRNLQDRLSKEKAEWQRERAMQEEQLTEQRNKLNKQEEQIRALNTDVQQQRENLYQKLEALRGQGILLSPNMTIVSTAPIGSSTGATSPPVCEEIEIVASSPPPPAAPPSASTLLPSPTSSSVELNRRKTISGGPNSAGMGSAAAGLLKRDSCSTLPLNINLLSAKNQQKAAVTSLPIKQQLPMKLAKLASSGPSASGNPTAGASTSLSGTHALTASVSSPPSGGLVQQLLPLRLSENLEHKRASPKISSTESFKPKLSSSSFSPPASKNEDFVVGHNRTGSSPASIQMLSPRHHAVAAQPPKIPDKPANLLLQQATRGGSPQLAHPPQQQPPPLPPRVHDPETNQEIVFL